MEENKRGNPNFKSKKGADVPFEEDKWLKFQLIDTHEGYKPVDSKTGEKPHSLYPPIFMVDNSGVAYDEGGDRRWRYVHGYNTIWADDQKPEPTKQQLNSEKNDLIFKDGRLLVRSIDKAKVAALMIQDGYDGRKIQHSPKPRVFTLINEEDLSQRVIDNIEMEYEALKAAKDATLDEMLACANYFGIDIGLPEKVIKKQFLLRAKQYPSVFLKQFVNPKNKIKLDVSKALEQNIISASQIQGKLVWGENGSIIMDINSTGDVSDEITELVMADESVALKLYSQLKKLIV